MKFLIQKIDGRVAHDFTQTLLNSCEYRKWIHRNPNVDTIKYLNTNGDKVDINQFKNFHRNYVPVGSVEFVSAFLYRFYNLTPKPINVPQELFHPRYAQRPIINGNHMDFENVLGGKYFAKSNDKIKGYAEILELKKPGALPLPAGYYQVSEYISIDSEWRVFVYKNELVGIQNYCGEFTKFPNVDTIKSMIYTYQSAAPIAYTLDVGINDTNGTFVIEVHDFFSCGLYGFTNHTKYPKMLHDWFWEYVKKEK